MANRTKVIKNTNFDIDTKLDPTARIPISSLDIPHYVMAQPLGFHATDPINTYMQKLDDEQRLVDRPRALQQWQNLYNHIAAEGVVYLLPVPNSPNYQDLMFASNMGVVIDDFEGKDVVVISNFKYTARQAETQLGQKYFELMGFETHVCPYVFEGAADLKKIGPKLYVGGYGVRTDIKALEWIEEKFGVKVIKVKMQNEDLYHLDVNFDILTNEDAVCCMESFNGEDIKQLEKHLYLNPVTTEQANFGASSFIRHYNQVIFGSFIHECDKDDPEYKIERDKNRFLEDLCSDLGLDLVLVNLSEGYKGGGDISCFAMPLNHASYNVDLI